MHIKGSCFRVHFHGWRYRATPPHCSQVRRGTCSTVCSSFQILGSRNLRLVIEVRQGREGEWIRVRGTRSTPRDAHGMLYDCLWARQSKCTSSIFTCLFVFHGVPLRSGPKSITLLLPHSCAIDKTIYLQQMLALQGSPGHDTFGTNKMPRRAYCASSRTLFILILSRALSCKVPRSEGMAEDFKSNTLDVLHALCCKLWDSQAEGLDRL